MANAKLAFPPLDVLSREQCDRLHQATMQVLIRTGVQVAHAEARSILVDAGAKIAAGGRITVPEDVVWAAVKRAPSTITLTGLDPNKRVDIGGDNVYFMSGAGMLDVLDLDGNLRASTLEDLADFTRLCDALENLDVHHGILDPREAQGPALYPLAASRIIPNSTKPMALVIDTARDVEAISEMAEVALGSAEAVRERPFFTIHDSNTRPPLHHDEKNEAVLLAAVRRGFPTGLTDWPMPGLSSPVTVAGSMVQKYASFFVGLILAQTVNPGNPYIFPVEIGGVDMRTGNVVTASPEICLAGMAGAQMARYYGLPSIAVTATDAKVPDAQAGAEKAFLLAAQALAGVNLIHGCTNEMDGMLVASFEQTVIDDDIMAMVRRMISGFPIDEDSLGLKVIDELAPGEGNFLDHDHTLAHFRQAVWEPRVFTRARRADWLEKGAPDARKRAAERARAILAEVRPSPLSPAQVREIERIAETYRRGKA
jgi:trimethylamine--corrinoid protein Co-methyltransferase